MTASSLHNGVSCSKVMFFLTKGLLGLVILLPLLLIFGALVLAVVPLGLVLLVAPLVVVGGLIFGLVAC